MWSTIIYLLFDTSQGNQIIETILVIIICFQIILALPFYKVSFISVKPDAKQEKKIVTFSSSKIHKSK